MPQLYVLKTNAKQKTTVLWSEPNSTDTAWTKSLESLKEAELKDFLSSKNWTLHSLQAGNDRYHLIHPAELETAYTGFFYKIVENSHDEIYVCDGEGRTLYCNMTFERNYGLKREDMLGKTAMYLTEQGYSDQSPVPEVIRTKKTVTMNQRTITGKNLVITATPYLSETGDIAFIVENCRDTTELEEVRTQLESKVIEAQRYKMEAESIRRLEGSSNFERFNGSPSMKKVASIAQKVAATDATVLILGESGSGKSHIAQYIHQNSNRHDKPYISINCSTIAPSLFESELFGYASGAFTGASAKGKIGQVELANGGTLFLDEIGELPLALQVKLLELIQEKKYLPVGAMRYKQADVRIITATNRELKQLVSEKLFREDLFYRLRVIEIEMPPLRKRKDDIDGLLNHFLSYYNHEYGSSKLLSPDTRRILNAYQWPGNIRELQNLIHNLVIMAPGSEILPADLPGTVILESSQPEGLQDFGDLDHLMATYEQAIIQRCYKTADSSYKLAQALNISQSKASRLIRKYVTDGC